MRLRTDEFNEPGAITAPRFEALEPRLLLSASLHVVLVDAQLEQHEQIVAAAHASTHVVVYDSAHESASDVLARVTDLAREQGTTFDSLSIFSHGQTGRFALGNQWINERHLLDNQQTWQQLAASLSDAASIYLFGCNVAVDGTELLSTLAGITGADVFASTDLTGFGGNWELEAGTTTGTWDMHSAALPMSFEALQDYAGTLVDAPTGLATNVVSSSRIDLSWNDVADEDAYRVQISRDGSNWVTYSTVAANATTEQVTGLTATTQYYFRIVSVNAGEPLAASGSVSATTLNLTATLPAPWNTGDIGGVAAAGSASEAAGTYTIAGSGADIWDTSDEFRFVYQTLSGDGTITARVTSVSNTDQWAKAGVMIRDSLATGSKHAMTVVTPGNGVAFQYRTNTNGASSNANTTGLSAPYWVRVTRSGNTLSSYRSADGTNWTLVGSANITMGTDAYVGLVVTSHNDGVLSTATFDNVSIVSANTVPAAPSGLTATAASKTQINLSWTDNANNENGFTIERSTDGINFSTLVSLAANTTSYSNTGLTADTTYFYRVRATSFQGNSAFSSVGGGHTHSTANDAYSVNEDNTLDVLAGAGVLSNDVDAQGDTLYVSLVSGPSHGSLTLNADGSFSYTPDANYNGSDSFTYRASDGTEFSNIATVTITINAVNDAPVADDDSYSTNEDTALIVPAGTGVLTNDTDIESDALTAELVAGPSHGSLTLNADGSFSYTPDAHYNGTDTFTYRAYDGVAYSNVATVTITINAVNDAPVAGDDSYSTNEDTALIVPAGTGVLTNDTDIENDALTAELVAGPSHGSLTLNADGSFSYTPDANYNGSDSFTYRAYDGVAYSNVATVTITINAVNDAPVANDDSYSTNEDTALIVPAGTGVLANDTDIENDALTAELVTGPSHGSLTLNADGSFSYTPDANYNGSDSFTYRAYDGVAYSNVATVTITINAVNDAPVAQNDLYTTDEDQPLAVSSPGVIGNDADVDGNPLQASLVTGPAHGSLEFNADGSFTYTPDTHFNGFDSFTYRVSDSLAYSNIAMVTIQVLPVNDAPVIHAPSEQIGLHLFSMLHSNSITVSDLDAGSNPVHVHLEINHGLITLGSTNGLRFFEGDGSDDRIISFTGSIDDINLAFNGLFISPGRSVTQLLILVNDLGNFGSGGELTDTVTIEISLHYASPDARYVEIHLDSLQSLEPISYERASHGLDAELAGNVLRDPGTPVGVGILAGEQWLHDAQDALDHVTFQEPGQDTSTATDALSIDEPSARFVIDMQTRSISQLAAVEPTKELMFYSIDETAPQVTSNSDTTTARVATALDNAVTENVKITSIAAIIAAATVLWATRSGRMCVSSVHALPVACRQWSRRLLHGWLLH